MKTKKYILTPTGEFRRPKVGEYYIDSAGNISQAYCKTINSYPILKLEVIEEEWKPKEGEEVWYVNLRHKLVFKINYYLDYKEDVIEFGLVFPAKELAEARLREVLGFLKGEKSC